jgi:6-phosphogluconolactonase
VNADIRVSEDPAGAAAEILAAARGHVALTGGSTPRAAYQRVAGMRPDWSGVDVWFTDERCVAPTHEHSNFRMADEALLSKVEGATVHRMRGELGPEDGAAAYICSLFPGDDALGERDRRAVGVETPGMAPLVSRVTLTLPVVNGSGQIVFLVTGDDKAEAVERVFSGPPDPRVPGSVVDGSVVALLDAAAAARL